MSQPLPTSISYTKLEIATYIHELADKLLPSTTSQYILLGTTQLAPNTTLHYKPCKNYFPVLLCTTKLAQSTSQYYFVLQSLHCTKSFPIYYNLQLQNRISTPQQKKRRFASTLKKDLYNQNCENLLTNHCRSLDAATPIRFTRSSCKRQ